MRVAARWTPIALVAVLLTGCPGTGTRPPAARIWDFTDAGVIESTEVTDQDVRVTLARGDTIVLEAPGTFFRNGPTFWEAGELLIVGTSPRGALGTMTLFPRNDGCFYWAEGGFDDGSHILLSSGFRLPKAANFDPGRFHEGDVFAGNDFCINESGEVVSFGP